MAKPRARRPGELAFALGLLAFGVWAFAESYGIAGFDRPSGAGSVPMLAAGILIVSALAIIRNVWVETTPQSSSLGEVLRFLAPPRMLLFIALMIAFAAAIAPLGFFSAAGGFAFASMALLWRRGPLWSAGATALAIMVIWAVFRVLFQVVLPVGTVWRDIGL